jgi:hypothetical protein
VKNVLADGSPLLRVGELDNSRFFQAQVVIGSRGKVAAISATVVAALAGLLICWRRSSKPSPMIAWLRGPMK